MTKIIDGKKASAEIKEELKFKSKELFEKTGVKPGLAVLLVGDDPASAIYVGSKEKTSKELGYFSIVERRDSSITQKEVLEIIDRWNTDPMIHGILVQSPLPKHINESEVVLAISPEKDVDGFHPENIGKLVLGLDGFAPCTPAGIMELLRRYEIETKGKHAVILGRSSIVGKPLANMLYQKKDGANAIVTICHTGAENPKKYVADADIVVAAMGVPRAIGPDDIKEGAVCIDVGINRVEDKTRPKGYRVVGDIDFDAVKDKCSAITPVPGGVGPMTIAMLMTNTYLSAKKSAGLAD